MPPIVVKTGSAFVSNGFGRFINTNVKSEMARGKLIRGNHRAQLDIKRGPMASCHRPSLCASAPGESTHPQIWIRRDLFRRAGPQNASPYHFYFLNPFRANLSRDTVALLVLNCCELHIYAAKTTHRLKPTATNDLVACGVRKF